MDGRRVYYPSDDRYCNFAYTYLHNFIATTSDGESFVPSTERR